MKTTDENTIKKALDKLDSLREVHLKIAKEMLEADQGNIFPLDLFMLGIIKRSLLLLKGFCDLVRPNNFTSAAPLVRLHLDDLLHIYAAFIAENPHKFAMKKLKGKRTNNLKDKNGKKMSDNYLAKQLSKNKEFSWVKKVYKETSKFIHFSDKHIFSTVQSIGENKTIEVLIPSDNEIVPKQAQLEAISAMNAITYGLFRYLYGWVKTKNNRPKK